ncbi:glycosyltransferase [Patescibacteria group bacterium]|nr:glycosyltransferase [Patescibacteria group bacterium]
MKKKIAILHPHFGWGGGETVCVWMIHALKDKFEIDLIITEKKVTIYKINKFYETNFNDHDFNIINVFFPIRGYLLQNHLVQRYFKNNSKKYDFAISTNNEMDFGKKGIQYIHYPILEKKKKNILKKLYTKFVFFLSKYQSKRMQNNLTYTNSLWTKRQIKKIYNLESKVIYPSLVDEFPFVNREEKKEGFVCLGRITPAKELEKVIEILSEVKKKFPSITLDIIGHIEEKKYFKKIENMVNKKSDWIKLRTNLSGKELKESMIKFKYDIHGMKNEHFGIVILEMIKAGMIPFVANDGGQVEIVDDENLIYRDREDAVKKIEKVLKNNLWQKEILIKLQEQD